VILLVKDQLKKILEREEKKEKTKIKGKTGKRITFPIST